MASSVALYRGTGLKLHYPFFVLDPLPVANRGEERHAQSESMTAAYVNTFIRSGIEVIQKQKCPPACGREQPSDGAMNHAASPSTPWRPT